MPFERNNYLELINTIQISELYIDVLKISRHNTLNRRYFNKLRF